jgi:hypothetical protein
MYSPVDATVDFTELSCSVSTFKSILMSNSCSFNTQWKLRLYYLQQIHISAPYVKTSK